ncbi:MAG: nitroreductase family protein [Clostridia bacterium]|nr:nitroreductase family protein [Clostridia bacterium]MBT7123448.1 nitroreductase family protein [Clostridia bacterium]
MDMLKPILERRSHRSFLDKSVPEDVLENLLKAGMFAPSAMNSQPCEFLIMKDDEKRARTAELIHTWSMLKNAPLGILVLMNTNGYRASTKEFIVQDCAAATQNILLAAQAQGLGGVWLGLYPKPDIMKEISRIYDIPDHVKPFSITAIGYPYKELRPHRTFIEHKVHVDKY